ncbi:TolC family protein [bacterium]|nr:TolC family protein [bacterium]
MRFSISAITLVGGLCLQVAASGSEIIPAHDLPGVGLEEALAEALDGNLGLQAAGYDRQRALARIGEARASLFPDLTAMAGYTRYSDPNTVLPIHQAGVFPPLDDDIYEGSLSLQMSLFDGGRRRAGIMAARAGAEAATADLDQARQATTAAVSGLFIQARRLEDNLELIRGRIAALDVRRTETADLVGAGRAAPGDLSLLVSSLDGARADSLAVESALREVAWLLAGWMGRGTPVYPQPAPRPAATGPDAHHQGEPSPAMREAEARLRQSRASAEAARRAIWPELSAFGTLRSRAGDDLDFKEEWAVGLAVKLPLYTGGELKASAQGAQAAHLAAGRRLAAVRQETHIGMEVASQRLQAAEGQLGLVLGSAAAKARAVEAQVELYEAGRLALSTLLADENELLALKIRSAALRNDVRLARIEFHRSAGTLTPPLALDLVEGE